MMRVRFVAVTLLLLGLAGCAGSPPPQPYPRLSWSYLTKLRLDVAQLVIDDSWVPSGEARHVEYLAPEQPVTALRQMALDRLEMDGTAGTADFVVDDASIIKVHDHYDAHFAVHLTLRDANGKPLGEVKAEVKDSRTFISESPEAQRQDLYALVKKTMSDMNVEFEYEMRKHLGKFLLAEKPLAPPPPTVQSQGLGKPGSPLPSFPPTPAAPSLTAPSPTAPTTSAASPAAPNPAALTTSAPPASGTAPTSLTPPTTAVPAGSSTVPVPNAAVPPGQTVITHTLAPTLTPMGPAQAPLPAVPAGPLRIQTAPVGPATK